MAIARGDLGAVKRLLQTWEPLGLEDVEGAIQSLDALVALDRRDDIDAEAPAMVIPGSTSSRSRSVRSAGRARPRT